MNIFQGLSKSTASEKIEITEACTYADLCNVFEDPSLVSFCFSLTLCKYENDGGATTQVLITITSVV